MNDSVQVAQKLHVPTNPDCENCGTRRTGPFCQLCGQHEDTAHHSVRRLLVEAVEHLFNTDGMVFRTLRGILLHPAALTRDYLAGKRAAQMPPVQLFFVMLVLFLFIGEHEIIVDIESPSAAQAALVPPWMRWSLAVGSRIRAHGGSFIGLLKQSAEIFGFLMVPVAALLLWGLYAGRGKRLYDHLVFSLHSLSFFLLISGIGLMLSDNANFWSVLLIVILAVHLFVHMRGVYGSGIFGTLTRMVLLGFGTLIAYTALSIVWIATAYFAMGI